MLANHPPVPYADRVTVQSDRKAKPMFDELPLFRSTDPDTSRKGADHVRLRTGSQQAQLLRAYAHPAALEGLTADQAGQASGLADNPRCGYWKRVSELRTLGLIADTGTTRPGISGAEQMVCAITEAGLDAIGRLRMDEARNA